MRHIPAGDTQEMNILTFKEACKHKAEGCTYDTEKWIYIPDFYSEYRYILGTVGKRPLITIGINPSTASPDALDNTLKSVGRIARFNGFDSFIMFNVYAQRATKPDDMDKLCNELLHKENMKAFRWVLKRSKEPPSIWAAWGTLITKRPYLRLCLEDMVKEGTHAGARWYMAGKPSVHGHPHHPLYLKKETRLTSFDVEGYLKSQAFT